MSRALLPQGENRCDDSANTRAQNTQPVLVLLAYKLRLSMGDWLVANFP